MHRFSRGSVVVRVRDARYSVVWDDGAAGLVLLPVFDPPHAHRDDVLLELPDMIATGVPIAHAVIRPRLAQPIDRAGHVKTGTVPGAVMCRVVVGMVRAAAEAEVLARWSGHREHMHRVRDEVSAVK